MIFLVRHGETALNAARVVQPADTPLSERGVRQARLLARRLEALGVAHVLCSDMPRARMTAEALTQLTGAPREESALLQERNFGDLRGTPYAALKVDLFGPDYEPPGGESWKVFDARVAEAWSLVTQRAAGTNGHLAVVTHGLVCRSIAQQFLSVPGNEAVPARFGNTSLTVFESSPPFAVERLNCTEHLRDDAAGADDGAAGAV